MKNSLRLAILCSMALASNSYATISCSKAKLSEPTSRDTIYHFKATVTCDLVDEKIDLKAIKDAFLDDITKKGSQFKIYKQTSYNDKGLSGYKIDATQSYVTDHGAMRVKADIIIADDQTKDFFYEYRSRSISAEGDAALDKSILNTTTLELDQNKGKLKLVKEINVEEPWYAPHGTFIDTVESELTESIKKAAMSSAKKICGQKVDALSK